MDAGEDAAARAAAVVSDADALLVTAGAGMGVDSGLPDFRGDAGFWKAYPAYAHLGLSFVDLANPRWFADDAHLAWGFYGHRLNLYRGTRPHGGFGILRRWVAARPAGGFVFTSNVDGQFQRAGFDPEKIVECHGTVETWQCTRDCGMGLFPASLSAIAVDRESFRAAEPLPRCGGCGALARPNVLMFGDGGWDESRTDAQHRRFERWLAGLESGHQRLAVVECGAGTAVPTVRRLGEALARRPGTSLIRINPREPEAPAPAISLARKAHEAIEAIDRLLGGRAP